MSRDRFETSAVWLLLAVYFALSVGMLLSNPLLESPDELLNYENMRYIIKHKELPVLQPGEMSKAHHPPLYYLLGAVITSPIPAENLDAMGENINKFFGFRTYDFGVDNKSQYLHGTAAEAWPWHDAALALYILRFVSILMGVGGILAVYKIGRALFSDHAPALVAAAVVAFNPMYVYIQSSVHNDALTNMLAACTILSLVVYWQKPSIKQAAIVGTIAALGILTKITFLFLGPVVLIVMLGRHFIHPEGRGNRDWAGFVKNLLVAGIIVVALAGWWFVRNQILYGEPTSMELQASIWQPRPNAPDWDAAVRELSYLRDSFWGAFGFGQIVFPRWTYTMMNSFVVATVVGLVVWLLGWGKVAFKEKSQRWLLALLLVAPLTAFAATFSRMAVSGTANFGRYLFTSYGVLAILISLGLYSLVGLISGGKNSLDRPFALLLSFGLIGLNLFAIFGVVRPVFSPPPVYATADQVSPQIPIEIEFPGAAKLLGYSLDSMSAVPGQPFTVTLFWQEANGGTNENFSEFVQLVSADGERIAGRDTFHGLGRYPTSNWQPNEIIADKVTLYLPEEIDLGPAGLRLNIGLKDEIGQAVPLANGETTVSLGSVRLAPLTEQALKTPLYTFGDAINLIELSQLAESVQLGETLNLDFVWQSAAPVADDYVVLIHWVNPGENRPIATFDAPADVNFPTSLWRPNDTIDDQRMLEVPADLPPGKYQVLIGLYYQRSDSEFPRLPVNGTAENITPDNAIIIGEITVAQ
ncbi:MAG: ArnT family glycosyltransferase [Anaerolineae bacterium]